MALSGTLTVTGDVSFDGGAFTFNQSGAAVDARFEGDTDQNLIITDGSTDRVGMGIAAPNSCLLYTSPSPRDRTRSRMPSSA